MRPDCWPVKKVSRRNENTHSGPILSSSRYRKPRPSAVHQTDTVSAGMRKSWKGRTKSLSCALAMDIRRRLYRSLCGGGSIPPMLILTCSINKMRSAVRDDGSSIRRPSHRILSKCHQIKSYFEPNGQTIEESLWKHQHAVVCRKKDVQVYVLAIFGIIKNDVIRSIRPITFKPWHLSIVFKRLVLIKHSNLNVDSWSNPSKRRTLKGCKRQSVWEEIAKFEKSIKTFDSVQFSSPWWSSYQINFKSTMLWNVIYFS